MRFNSVHVLEKEIERKKCGFNRPVDPTIQRLCSDVIYADQPPEVLAIVGCPMTNWR